MRCLAIAPLLALAAPALAAPVVTRIDAPGASITYAEAISPSGIVAGAYAPAHTDACGMRCGYLRMPDGTFTTFPVFAATNMGAETVLDDATVAGVYLKGHNNRGFIRSPDGTLTDIFFKKADAIVKGLDDSGIAAGQTPAPRAKTSSCARPTAT
ncbi:MAG: hypothetical protein JOZ72_00575 [Alphaproteobacteria bacterium]|nr:hypothetical protein [Alphaproteobacteria bacterium]